MVVGMLLYSFVLQLELIKYPIPSHLMMRRYLSRSWETSRCYDAQSTRDRGSRWEPLSAWLDCPSEKPPRAYRPGGGVGGAPDATGL